MTLAGPIPGPITLKEIVIQPYEWVHKNDLLFVVSAPSGTYGVRSNMQGGFAALRFKEGQAIAEGEQFGCMVADGENIPYGEPYVLATLIT